MGIARHVLMDAAHKLGWKAVCPDCGKPGCTCGQEICECPVCACETGDVCHCEKPGVCECGAWQQFEGAGVIMVAQFKRGWVIDILAAPITAQVGGIDAGELEIYDRVKTGGRFTWKIDKVMAFLPTPVMMARRLGLGGAR